MRDGDRFDRITEWIILGAIFLASAEWAWTNVNAGCQGYGCG